MKKYLYRLELDFGFDPNYYTKTEAEKIIKSAKKEIYKDFRKIPWKPTKKKIKLLP